MPSMPWIKLYTEMLDDPKLGRLTDGQKWRFVQLCLFAGECDAEGWLVNGETPHTLGDIAWRLRVDRDVAEADLATLEQIGLITRDGEAVCVTAFADRQGRSQSEKRDAWRERKRRQRDTENVTEHVTRESRGSHAGVTALDKTRQEQEEDTEEDREAEAEADARPTAAGPQTRDPLLVRQHLERIGIKEPKLSELTSSPWVTIDYIDMWDRYTRTWKLGDDGRIASMISRMIARRMPPPEFRQEVELEAI